MNVTIAGGGGGVGSSVAFNLLLGGKPHDLVLVDSRPNALESHLMDLEQVLELAPGSSVRGGTEDDLADADVLVLTASVPLEINTSRLAYLADNARVVDQLVDALPTGWAGVLLVVTNPVDPLVTRIRIRTGIDRRRVIGYTMNDSLRLRTGLAAALGVPPGSVRAWVLGEHGDACVPLRDRITVDGRPVQATDEQFSQARGFLAGWYRRHVALDSGRSSTWTSGLGIARMIETLADGGGETWVASVVLEGEYGIEGVAVTVPVGLGSGGVTRVEEWRLGDDDLLALRASAEIVRGVVVELEPAPAGR